MTVAGTSSLVYGKLIGAAFVAQRGLALGVATSGLSIRTFTLPPLVALVIAAYGWRGGYLALGILAAGRVWSDDRVGGVVPDAEGSRGRGELSPFRSRSMPSVPISP